MKARAADAYRPAVRPEAEPPMSSRRERRSRACATAVAKPTWERNVLDIMKDRASSMERAPSEKYTSTRALQVSATDAGLTTKQPEQGGCRPPWLPRNAPKTKLWYGYSDEFGNLISLESSLARGGPPAIRGLLDWLRSDDPPADVDEVVRLQLQCRAGASSWSPPLPLWCF